MTEIELKEIFESDFSWDKWRKVMDFVFPEFEFSSVKVPIDKFTKAAENSIKGFYQHGSLSLEDGVTLSLFETELFESVNIPRNVKGIRKFIAEEAIANTQASIAVFYSEDKSKWRFTLAIKKLDEESKEKDHKPDSFTYVFGQGEKGRTAADRFVKLAGIKEKKLADLEEAFSVEALSKKFFVQYTSVYKEFVDNITNNPSRISLFKGNDPEKKARDFVKKMMGRIVFLYFLQKKGWMGCKSKWTEGNGQFMLDLFNSAPKDELFYKNYLEELFFKVLNNKRKDIEEDCIIQETNYGKVPFLNGGLFECEEGHPDDLAIDWKIFNHFFDVLNNYNFTIIEDDPDFKEVAVDPEMLGHIFENLLEDNKDKGAFYTPKEIVQYMCQESLIEYLHTKLSTIIKSGDLKVAIRDLVTNQQFVKLNNINQNADKFVLQALRDIKVCDPAIGSGAFPMGILQEIFRMVELLEDNDVFHTIWEMDSWDAARVKEDIIQNSIYGVDIEKGAVDIARLRFWLSIIIDEEEPKPLPNLDYKIVVGNSLLNKFEDHVIDIEWEIIEGTQTSPETHKYVKRRKELLEQISEKQKAYFDAESTRRNALSKEIKDLKIDILVNQLEMKVVNEGIKSEPKQHNFPKKSSFVKAQQHYFLTLEWQDAIKKLKAIRGTNQPFNHFDWNLDFPEILNPIINQREKGFDVIIGNPPYIAFQRMVESNKKGLNKTTYETFNNTGDIYALFYEKGNDLLKSKGILSYITSRQWMQASYGKDLRRYLVTKTNPLQLIDFGQAKLFDGATVFVNILMFEKSSYKDKVQACLMPLDYQVSKVNLSNYFKINTQELTNLNENTWNVSYTGKINIKIEGIGVALGNWKNVEFYRGITSGFNEAFHINIDTYDYLISKNDNIKSIAKMLLRGKDIKRYAYDYNNLFILNTHNGVREINLPSVNVPKDYPEIYEHLSQWKSELENRQDKGDHWTNLRNCAFLMEFDKPKIIWIEISDKGNYAFDDKGMYLTNSAYFLTCKDDSVNLKYLLAVLNSKIADFYFSQKTARIAGGRMRYTKQYVQQIPVPQISVEEQKPFASLANCVLALKDQKISEAEFEIMALFFEQVIDVAVAEVYFKEEVDKHNLSVLDTVRKDLNEFPDITEVKSIYKEWSNHSHSVNKSILDIFNHEPFKTIEKSLKSK